MCFRGYNTRVDRVGLHVEGETTSKDTEKKKREKEKGRESLRRSLGLEEENIGEGGDGEWLGRKS